MSVRNLTWQQVIVCAMLLLGVVAAYKLFGELPAGVLLVITGIVNLLLGRDPPRPPSNGGGGMTNGLATGALCMLLVGCAAAPLDSELRDLASKLSKCRDEGRDAGTYDAYEACKKREGIIP